MKMALLILHVVVSAGLIGLILLQSSKGGLGSAFGGGEAFRTKRGAEKIVFNSTIALAVIFFVTSILNVMVR